MKQRFELTDELLHDALAVERPVANAALGVAIREGLATARPRRLRIGVFRASTLSPTWLLVILALAAIAGAAIVGARLIDQRRPAELAYPTADPSRTSSPAPTELFVDGLAIAEIAEPTGLAAADDSIWLVLDGRDRGFLRVDVATRDTALIPLPPGPRLVTPAIGPRYVWTAAPDDGHSVLYRVDRSGTGRPEAFDIDVAVSSLGIDDQGRLWAKADRTALLLADDGARITSVSVGGGSDPPALQKIFVPPAFGSLWAHAGDRVIRVDPSDGSLLATVPLEDCKPIPDSHHLTFHTGLLYPLNGVEGVPDGIAVACWELDAGGILGPLSLIDPRTNRVAARFDVPSQRQPGVVADGGWFVALGPRTIGRVDPVIGSVGAEMRLPQGSTVALASAGGSVWILVTGQPGEARLISLPADRLPQP